MEIIIKRSAKTNPPQKAKELFKKKSKKKSYSEVDQIKLIHELEVHQIELELQNKELIFTRKEAEESAKKFIEFYDFAPIGYLTLSPSARIEKINVAGTNMLGKELSLLIGSNFRFWITENTRPVFDLFFKKLFETKVKETCEVKFLTIENLLMYVQINGIVTESKEKCFLMLFDITERKLLENELKLSNEIIQNLAEGVYVIRSEDGIIVYANQKFENMFGYNPGELLGKNVSIVNAPGLKTPQETKNEILDFLKGISKNS